MLGDPDPAQLQERMTDHKDIGIEGDDWEYLETLDVPPRGPWNTR